MYVGLTLAIRSLQVVAMKYIGTADHVLDTIVPIVEGLPIISVKIKEFMKDAHILSEIIKSSSEMAEKVLPGVEAGLTTADMNKLKASTGQVANLTKALQAMTPAGAK